MKGGLQSALMGHRLTFLFPVVGFILLSAFGFSVARVQAGPVLVYDDGPITGDPGAPDITFYMWSNSFTIGSGTSLTSAQIGVWVDQSSGLPLTVDWSIGTTPLASDISSGTANLSNTFVGIGGFSNVYYAYESVFDINGLLPGPGTYYFTLENGTTSIFSDLTWAHGNGPSLSYSNLSGPNNPMNEPLSFQLYGITSVPEGGSNLSMLALALAGLLGIANLPRRSAASR
jgi:hypothetical protein